MSATRTAERSTARGRVTYPSSCTVPTPPPPNTVLPSTCAALARRRVPVATMLPPNEPGPSSARVCPLTTSAPVRVRLPPELVMEPRRVTTLPLRCTSEAVAPFGTVALVKATVAPPKPVVCRVPAQLDSVARVYGASKVVVTPAEGPTTHKHTQRMRFDRSFEHLSKGKGEERQHTDGGGGDGGAGEQRHSTQSGRATTGHRHTGQHRHA
jgi:hypothetical protein